MLKSDHIFVILRTDRYQTEPLVTVTSAVWTREAAEAEVARLNALNGPKGCEYSWQIARLRRPSNAKSSRVQ